MDISKIKLGNTTYDVKDSSARSKLSSGEIVHYLTNVSGTAGTSNSNRTQWTGTASEVSALYTGLMVMVKIPLAGVNKGVTLNVNSLGEHPVVLNANSIVTTHYPVNTILTLVYDASQKATVMVSGTNTEYTGCWKIANYDSGNTYPQAQCETAAATQAKTASCSNFTLANKSYIMVNMRYANSYDGKITLNINGTGAKDVYINGAVSSSSNKTLPAGSYLVYYADSKFYFRTDGKITGSITGDAATVNGKTVGVNVPSTAVFTDTKYTFAGGTNKFTVTPSGGSAQDVTVTPSISNNVTASGNFAANAIVVGNAANQVAKNSGVTISTTTPSSSSGDTTVPTSKAVWNAVANGIAANDAMVYKGTVAGGSTGTYGALTPAASKGETYKVTTAGKIDGIAVEIGDMLICNTDSTAAATSSNYSTIAANWDFIQTNIDGAVTGPASSTSGNLASYDGATGKVIKDSGLTTTNVSDAVSKKHSHSTLTLSTTAQAYDGSHTLALPASDPYTSARTPSSHSHGNIQNGGTLNDTAAAAAGNDYVVIRDADNSKIQTSTIKGTDVADAVSKKHSHSSLTLSTTAQAYDGSHTLALPSSDPYSSARTPSSHTHGNIQNGGTLQTNDITIANGDKLVVTDSSDSSKVARTSVSFDGSTTTTALTPKGTFESFSKFSGSYNDLTNKPTIPAAASNGTFSVKTKVGSNAAVTAADFTANQSSADDVTFIQGSNVTLSTDTTNRTITINAVQRAITDSYTGSSTTTAVSQAGAKALYNALLNGYANSAGDADTVDGFHSYELMYEYSNCLDSSNKIYDIPAYSVFSGYQIADAPSGTGWITGLAVAHSHNNNHYQTYLITDGSTWWTTNSYENGSMTNWKQFLTSANYSSYVYTKAQCDNKYLPYIGTGYAHCEGQGQNMYFKISTISTNKTYCNTPIIFEIYQRNTELSLLQITFESTSTTDPELQSFTTNNVNEYYIKKTATSTWELYGKYNESYGAAHLIRVVPGTLESRVAVNMTNIGASLPSGCTQCVYSGNAKYAYTASKDGMGNVIANTYLPLAGGDLTGTIYTPGTDITVMAPKRNKYDNIGAQNYRFWQICGTDLYGNLEDTTATCKNLNPKTDKTYACGASGNAWASMETVSINNSTDVLNIQNTAEKNVRICCYQNQDNSTGGYVGIGKASPSYKLHVNGACGATSHPTTSDMRLKNVQQDLSMSIDDIANAPLFLFKWREGGDSLTHVGSSAQYWKEKVPELVSEANDDIKTLSLEYEVLGTASSITIAKEVVSLKEEIKLLKAQIVELKQLLNK